MRRDIDARHEQELEKLFAETGWSEERMAKKRAEIRAARAEANGAKRKRPGK